MTDFTLTDYDGNPIEIGTKVRMWDDPEMKQGVGEVTDLGEFEGDVDDDTGRSILNNPVIIVKFDDATEQFVTSEWEWETGFNPADPDTYYGRVPTVGKVEEVVVVK
jgi:hypothetical protein